ncbi:MgtC/SapB family protein [Kitasatospora purpeofusca]|nr:MgtC/SapB family protein [Kitasatospora purpeofusca]MDY0809983.1 MgtC/SapB family protein [Kitasatospora purpeofusca]
MTDGQGGRQMIELAAALVLSSLIGLEREAGQKSAGLRTHALVGLGSALFVNVSAHAFGAGDPSRVAAQVVSGIGFIGGGIIFVRRDAVHGLTTAATIWLTCAVGMACAGGLLIVATACTAGYFLIIRGYPFLLRRLAPALAAGTVTVELTYRIGYALLPRVLEECAEAGFRILDTAIDRPHGAEDGTLTHVRLTLEGRGDAQALAARLAEFDGARAVSTGMSDSGPPVPRMR